MEDKSKTKTLAWEDKSKTKTLTNNKTVVLNKNFKAEPIKDGQFSATQFNPFCKHIFIPTYENKTKEAIIYDTNNPTGMDLFYEEMLM